MKKATPANILAEALDLIKKKNLIFLKDLYALSIYSMSSHKLRCPPESSERIEMDTALSKNRVEMKVKLRKKWYESDNATVQIALYKIICTEEEAHRLNGSKQEINGKIEHKISKIESVIVRSKEDLNLLQKKNDKNSKKTISATAKVKKARGRPRKSSKPS